MGDEDERDAKLVLQVLEFKLHAFAQLHVQCRKRLVQQQQFRSVDDGACQSYTLLLAAGHPARKTLFKRFQANHCKCFPGSFLRFQTINTLAPWSVGHVFQYGHMREQRVVLKDCIEWSTVGRQAADVLAIDAQGAGVRLQEAGDRAQ
ncbi:hypothetical protein D3C78_1475780 [compost metagenome]